MHTINTMRKKKKGVSTILGTIIFIGILFTSVIPMMLVMKQADNIYTQKVHEIEKRDEEQESQELEVYAFPVENEDKIRIGIENTGVVPAKIRRVWINNEYETENVTIATLESTILGPYNVTTFDGAQFGVFVTTFSANKFASASVTIYYDQGSWLAPQLGICVHIAVGFWGMGYFRTKVTNTTWDSGWVESGFVFLGDVVNDFAIETPGNYQVHAERKGWGASSYTPLTGSPKVTSVTYPDGPPVVTVTFGT